jgi:hypothetical protein
MSEDIPGLAGWLRAQVEVGCPAIGIPDPLAARGDPPLR